MPSVRRSNRIQGRKNPDQNTHTEDSQSFSPVEKYPSVQLIKKEDSVNNNCQESICDKKPKLNNSHIIIVDIIKGAKTSNLQMLYRKV